MSAIDEVSVKNFKHRVSQLVIKESKTIEMEEDEEQSKAH